MSAWPPRAAASLLLALVSIPLPDTAAGMSCPTTGIPDLTVLQSYLTGWTVVNGPGGGKQLRFSTAIANGGQGPLHLYPGATYPDGTRDIYQCVNGTETWAGRHVHHAGHSHIHMEHIARYRLRIRPADNSLGAVVAQNDATSFCLLDLSRYNPSLPGSPASPVYNTCSPSVEGISVGWNDVMSSGLADQFLDLACIPNGNYWLENEVDPEHLLAELNETNNVTRIPITLSGLPTVPAANQCPSPAAAGRLLAPSSVTVDAGQPTAAITGRFWVAGVTDPAGSSPDVAVELGFGPDGTAPSGIGWQWTAAAFAASAGADDDYTATLTPPAAGTYDYGWRFRYAGGPWVYADLDGSRNGFAAAQAGSMTVNTPSAVPGDAPTAPHAVALENPFRDTARLALSLAEPARVEVEVFDVIGRRVHSLPARTLAIGEHAITWNGRGADGTVVPAGLYFFRIAIDGRLGPVVRLVRRPD